MASKREQIKLKIDPVRNWFWCIDFGAAFVMFLFQLWTATMKMRPKIVQFTPSKTEETKLAA
ncbi:hypothetical protein DVG78_18280 [Runella aurantiaca]|uniref:Uncharacterized protein n=1 Tax=Runella aurantiaca TaxID=2282308 RepID=A0A369I488_9BACT|nr:hypothetical protein DVG78_18280 [Runella aurantiaca]